MAVLELFAGSRREVLMGRVRLPAAAGQQRRRSLAIQSPSMAPARETGRGAHPDGSMLIVPAIRSTCAPKSTGSSRIEGVARTNTYELVGIGHRSPAAERSAPQFAIRSHGAGCVHASRL